MKCPACGFETNNPRVAFCPNCGSRLTTDPASPFAPVSPADPAPASDVTRPAAESPASIDINPERADITQNNYNEDLAPVVKTSNWFGTFLILLLVPLALAILAGLFGALLGDTPTSTLVSTIFVLLAGLSDLILYFVFAFGKRFNPSKRNFFKASLLLMLLTFVITIVLGILFSTVFVSSVPDTTELMDLLKQLGTTI